MRKLKIFLLVLGILILALFGLNRWLNSGSIEPDNSVWYKYIGRDTTVGLWPDIYANYFAYTYYKTKDNLGLKIKGKFPNTPYMSFNVYNLKDKTTQGSLIDSDIITQQSFEIADTDKSKNKEAGNYIGDYAPIGYRISTQDFLNTTISQL